MTSDHGTEASDLFAQGFNCAQSVFSVYAKEHGMDVALARKIATGFGGGVGRSGNMCGAVSGAIMAIGLIRGSSSPDESANKEMSYTLSNQFVQEFTARFGSVVCPALLGFDLGSPAEREEVQKQGTIRKICPDLVRGATEILDDILKKN